MEELPTILSGTPISGFLVAGLVLLVTLILYGVFSVILVYHWRQYAIGAHVVRLTLLTYFITTGTLLALALGSWFFI